MIDKNNRFNNQDVQRYLDVREGIGTRKGLKPEHRSAAWDDVTERPRDFGPGLAALEGRATGVARSSIKIRIRRLRPAISEVESPAQAGLIFYCSG